FFKNVYRARPTTALLLSHSVSEAKFHSKKSKREMRNQTPKLGHTTLLFLLCFIGIFTPHDVVAVQILSKSKLDKCEKNSASGNLNCTKKIVLNMAVPSGAVMIVRCSMKLQGGGEASIVAEIVEVEENSSQKMQTFRMPPVLTFNKSAAYALYELTYIREQPISRKSTMLRPANVSQMQMQKLRRYGKYRDFTFGIIHLTSNFVATVRTIVCVHLSIGLCCDVLFYSIFSVVFCVANLLSLWASAAVDKLMKGKANTLFATRKCLLVENRTAISNDNFLPVNLIGDFVGYTNIPSFEDFYLVIPKHAPPIICYFPLLLRVSFSFLLGEELFYVDAARERFSLDGVECNKIGVSYEDFNGQPNLCSLPFWSCLHNQLWNFWEADQNRIERNQLPLYGVEGRFERINQHPNAGTHSLSIGVTEVINTNLMIELSADDVEYVYQRSPGKIVSINGPTFEALTQFGTATITTRNTGEVEASYSLTFDCSSKLRDMVQTGDEMAQSINGRTNFLSLNAAILTDSDYKEVDRAECQFSTTSTVLDNVSQKKVKKLKVILLIHQRQPQPYLEQSVEYVGRIRHWKNFQHTNDIRKHRSEVDRSRTHVHKNHGHEARNHKHGSHHKRQNFHNDHMHNQFERGSGYYYQLHHVHKDKHKHGRRKHSSVMQKVDENTGYGQKQKRRLTKDYS
ncbi:hapless 2, partial [Prunus dulcis]